MRTKEELREDIKNLTKFELRENYIERDGEYVEQRQKAVVEVDGVSAVCYVSPRYHLFQFDEIFLPILDGIGDCEGRVQTHGGFAKMDLFPKAEEFENKWGITAWNSVDKTSSITIRFCTKRGNRMITLPPKIAGYNKPHSAKASINIQDFINVVTRVKDQWKEIIDKFGEYHVTEDNLGDIMENIKLEDKKLTKKIKEVLKTGMNYTLWDLFMEVIDHYSDKKYKSSIHKAKKIDSVCESIINYCFLLNL